MKKLWQTIREYLPKLIANILASRVFYQVESEGVVVPIVNYNQLVYTSSEKGRYTGFVSLANMTGGDTTEVSVYIKTRKPALASKEKYWGEKDKSVQVVGQQAEPILRINPIFSKYGISIVVTQSTGTSKPYYYQFHRFGMRGVLNA